MGESLFNLISVSCSIKQTRQQGGSYCCTTKWWKNKNWGHMICKKDDYWESNKFNEAQNLIKDVPKHVQHHLSLTKDYACAIRVLFTVIENCESALSEKMANTGFGAVSSLCHAWVQHPTFAPCCKKQHPLLVSPSCRLGPSWASLETEGENDHTKANIVYFS